MIHRLIQGAKKYSEDKVISIIQTLRPKQFSKLRRAIITAKRALDQLDYHPDILAIPIDTDWPQGYQWAIYESAEALLAGVNPEMERAELTFQSGGIESIRHTNHQRFWPAWKVHGIPSSIAWDYVLPLLDNSRQLQIERVS